jgi:hypothetical protein
MQQDLLLIVKFEQQHQKNERGDKDQAAMQCSLALPGSGLFAV